MLKYILENETLRKETEKKQEEVMFFPLYGVRGAATSWWFMSSTLSLVWGYPKYVTWELLSFGHPTNKVQARIKIEGRLVCTFHILCSRHDEPLRWMLGFVPLIIFQCIYYYDLKLAFLMQEEIVESIQISIHLIISVHLSSFCLVAMITLLHKYCVVLCLMKRIMQQNLFFYMYDNNRQVYFIIR